MLKNIIICTFHNPNSLNIFRFKHEKNRQIYDSYEMYNLSGEQLSFCSQRKARSYVVKKEIATWLDNDFNEITNEDVIFINEG